jgi:phage shock protein C
MSSQRDGGPDDCGPFAYDADERAPVRDDDWRPRTRRLCLDPRRRRIAGVCAGIARYYGMEPWVVRLIAITGLLFLPGIVFPAYWVAYFVMERPSGEYARWPSTRWMRMQARSHRGHRHRRRRSRSRDEYSSPAPELGPRISPRRGLRDVQADLTEVELRLRRIEAHVTSGRYELQRELHAIDNGATG